MDDLRHAVYSIIRLRPTAIAGQVEASSLGSGFFFGPDSFMTCCHVLNSPRAPHQPGDSYQLVNNLISKSGVLCGRIENVVNPGVGANLHFFPASDLAVISVKPSAPQRYAALDFGAVEVGQEIGVCGYPLSRLLPANQPGGPLTYDGLIFRAAKNAVSAVYHSDLTPAQNPPMSAVPLLEVNFLFVPGNSGGPIFDAETGRVCAFVHGYQASRIAENVVQTTIQPLPTGLGPTFIESLHAVYSVGIRLERVQTELRQFNPNV